MDKYNILIRQDIMTRSVEQIGVELAQELGMENPPSCTGDVIKMARMKQRMTQKELADEIGVAVASIKKYERCGRADGQYPPIPKLAKITAVLGIDARMLLAFAAETTEEKGAIWTPVLQDVMSANGENVAKMLERAMEQFFASMQASVETGQPSGPAAVFFEQMIAKGYEQGFEAGKNEGSTTPSEKNEPEGSVAKQSPSGSMTTQSPNANEGTGDG